VESVLETCPCNGWFGLENFMGADLVRMQGVSKPPAKNTNSISVLMLMTWNDIVPLQVVTSQTVLLYFLHSCLLHFR